MPDSWTGRYVRTKGRHAIRRAFPRTFFEELHAIRQDIASVGAHYLRYPGVWLAAGFALWSGYLVTLVLIGLPFDGAMHVILNITFAIDSPSTAVGGAYLDLIHQPHSYPVPQNIQTIGSAGWIVVGSFVFLIPALIALMLERLPDIAASLRGLMQPEVWDMFSEYIELLDTYRRTIVSLESATPADPAAERTLRHKLRKDMLIAITRLVTMWYRGQVALHANASVMRLTEPRDLPAGTPVLYRPANSTTSRYLELIEWAYDAEFLPKELFLFADLDVPPSGAPHAVMSKKPDTVSNALDRFEWLRRGMTPRQVEEIMEYFRGVPFRSVISIPLFNEWSDSGEVVGVLNVHVDRPGVFASGNRDTDYLVALLSKLCYFLVWLERKDRDAH